MRTRMLQELRKAFPDAKVSVFLTPGGKQCRIVLKRNGHMLLYEPTEELWNGPYSDTSMQGVIDEIRSMQDYKVDTYYSPETNKEKHSGRA